MGPAGGTFLAVDFETADNTDTSFGAISNCLDLLDCTPYTLDVVIGNVTDLVAAQLTLNYTGVVTARTVAVSLLNNETPDMGGSAAIDTGASDGLPDGSGTHTVVASNDSGIGSGGATGSGLLISFTLSPPGTPGIYPISLSGTALNDSTANPIAHTTQGGEIHLAASGCATPTPAPTESPTPTPTPTPSGQQVKFGDGDCSGEVKIADAQKTARTLLELSVTQTEPCPDIGATTSVNGVDRVWNDVDCSGSPLGISDAQKTARYLVDLSVSQTEPCPDIGEEVTIPAS